MADDTTAEKKGLETDIDWLRLERAEAWISRSVWLAPVILFSTIFLVWLTRSRLCWAITLVMVPFLSVLCLDRMRLVFVELKDLCCQLDGNLKELSAKPEGLDSRERRS